MHYLKSNYINKNQTMKLIYYTFKIKQNIGILGYESLGCIKLVVLELQSITRIGAQCYKYTGRSDAYFFIHVQGPLEDFHFQTQLANTLDKRIC